MLSTFHLIFPERSSQEYIPTTYLSKKKFAGNLALLVECLPYMFKEGPGFSPQYLKKKSWTGRMAQVRAPA
jgi:hypothetical protein